METVQQLPWEYDQIAVIDLQKNKKEALAVNILSSVIAIVMYLIRDRIEPFLIWLGKAAMEDRLIAGGIALIVCTVLYVILHEFTHGLAMKCFKGKEVRYGFTGMYAYAGSSRDYFPKGKYICIALAPVVIWGIIFAVLQALLPQWSWVIWFLQIMNVGGAAGDLYVVYRVSGMPDTILVMDTGVNMTVYDKVKLPIRS